METRTAFPRDLLYVDICAYNAAAAEQAVCVELTDDSSFAVFSFSETVGFKPRELIPGELPKKVARSEDTVEEAVEEAVEETVEEVEEAVEETGENPLETEKRRGLCGAATYRCSFNKEWSTRWPFITMGTTSSFYWCSVCRQENSCAHQGVSDISRHVEGKGHRAKEQSLNSVSSIAQFYVPETSVGGMSLQEAKTRRAEVKVAVAMVQHNVPFAVADHFSP
ncbi:hypothetical protein JOQ06_021331, partial [Pogonophryne albipinna]